jgi:hypothetical protein
LQYDVKLLSALYFSRSETATEELKRTAKSIIEFGKLYVTIAGQEKNFVDRANEGDPDILRMTLDEAKKRLEVVYLEGFRSYLIEKLNP